LHSLGRQWYFMQSLVPFTLVLPIARRLTEYGFVEYLISRVVASQWHIFQCFSIVVVYADKDDIPEKSFRLGRICPARKVEFKVENLSLMMCRRLVLSLVGKITIEESIVLP
jgi:hypothetical protein